MKLDRNTNRGGRGKYALVNMRKMIPLLDASQGTQQDTDCIEAFNLLVSQGIITLGTESPGEQFFVMKHKDQFTFEGLKGYADAVHRYARTLSDRKQATDLYEYARQVAEEAFKAGEIGNRIPD